MDKKGSDKIISVYWFVILFLVAAGVVYMVSAFYGSPRDVRDLEANLLADKIADCFSQQGFLGQDVFTEEFQNDFLSKCGITFNTEDEFGWKNDQFYVEAKVIDLSSNSQVALIQSGNFNLKDFCNDKGNNSPICIEKSVYSLDSAKKQYRVKILSIVRKTEKNAK